MAAEAIINVTLSKLPLTLGPGDGNVKFEYALASYAGIGGISVYPDGTIFVTKGEMQIVLKFVPQTKTLTWDHDTYDVSVKSPPSPDELLWISENKPTAKWGGGKEFSNFVLSAVAGKDSIEVTLDRSQGGWKKAYWYGLAFNAVDRNGVSKTVRDDPQIRDRGVPGFRAPHYFLTALGVLGAAVAAYIVWRLMHTG